MERLLRHVDVITRQRNRGQLEAATVGAIRELAGAERVGLYKLFTSSGDAVAGLAAEATHDATRMFDDGISWPAGTASLERFPHLAACLANGGTSFDLEPAGHRHAFAIAGGGGQTFGFVVVHTLDALTAGREALIAGLIAVFRNCLALLDYSEIDTLTGLLNRKTFDEYLINILSHVADGGDAQVADPQLPRRRRPQRDVAEGANDHWLGVIDIDHFKEINDRFGHLIGDEVLILVANLMKSTFRSQDKLFRFGGEEFVVLLKPAEAASAQATFERYRREVAEHVFPQVGRVTVSAGFTRIGLYDTPSMILDNADEALYYAKEHGRDRVCCYEELVAAGKSEKRRVLHTDAELF